MKLVVDGIDFAYNSHPVLAEVGFAVDRGQILCVLGKNGAGKSSLLKCINGVLSPRRGTTRLDGEDLSRMSPNGVARRMGYVPQRHPEARLTVFEAVLLGRKPHVRFRACAEDYAQVEEIIDQIGIATLAMRPLSDLSGGELQRVVIARALAQSPEVLLLDEPTSNLDLRSQLEVMKLIRHLVDTKNLTAVIAVHDLNIAVRFADKLLFLKDRRVHSVTSREELTPATIRQVYGVEVTLLKVGPHTIVAPL